MQNKVAPVSVIIHTKNSAQTLADTLMSVAWASEIIVMDMHSTDETISIAKAYNAKIHYFPDVGYVEPARNAAIALAKHSWICIVDSDEVISNELAVKLQSLSQGDATADAYFIPRKNMVFGGWLREAGWWPDYQLRFFRKGKVSWSDVIHSRPTIDGDVDYLPEAEQVAIEHANYPSVSSFIERLNRYTTHEVTTRTVTAHLDENELLTSWKNELFSRLFKLKGMNAGVRGVGVCMLQAMYELVVQLKMWEQHQAVGSNQVGKMQPGHKYSDESQTNSNSAQDPDPQKVLAFFQTFRSELQYWIADWHVRRTSGLSKIFWQFRRKFRI